MNLNAQQGSGRDPFFKTQILIRNWPIFEIWIRIRLKYPDPQPWLPEDTAFPSSLLEPVTYFTLKGGHAAGIPLFLSSNPELQTRIHIDGICLRTGPRSGSDKYNFVQFVQCSERVVWSIWTNNFEWRETVLVNSERLYQIDF